MIYISDLGCVFGYLFGCKGHSNYEMFTNRCIKIKSDHRIKYTNCSRYTKDKNCS